MKRINNVEELKIEIEKADVLPIDFVYNNKEYEIVKYTDIEKPYCFADENLDKHYYLTIDDLLNEVRIEEKKIENILDNVEYF